VPSTRHEDDAVGVYMQELTVDVGVVDEMARSWSRAARNVERLDVAGALEPVSTALPGSQTAAVAAGASVELAAAVRAYGDHLDDLASGAESSAASYSAVDSSVADRCGRLGSR
jgi:hypothetical protein